MHPQKFAVRWMFLLVCVTLTSSLIWLVNWSTTAASKTSKLQEEEEVARRILPEEILSTRTLMIEKQLGRPLIVDPNMPYIGYLKPGEWRKYDLPEGIGIGRGSRGKQRKKYGIKPSLNKGVKPRPKPKKKPSGKKMVDEDFDPNELFLHAALDEGVKAHVVAAENDEPIVLSQKDENDYPMQVVDSEDQGGVSSVGGANGLDYHVD